jgi:hypothetical protein
MLSGRSASQVSQLDNESHSARNGERNDKTVEKPYERAWVIVCGVNDCRDNNPSRITGLRHGHVGTYWPNCYITLNVKGG